MSLSTALNVNEQLSLLALAAAGTTLVANTFQGDGAPLVASLGFSAIAFSATYSMIRWLGGVFIRAGLKGADQCKARRPVLPETMGAICAAVYLLTLICFIPFPFYKDIVLATSGGGNRDVVEELAMVEKGRFLHRFPHSKLALYLAAIMSLQSVVILGIGDDLFDIRWRHKFFIPAFASIPMLVVYFVDFGVTSVVVPSVLQRYLGKVVNIGWIYYVYMAAIAIFAPNSINLLAGVNGIEVGQSLVIAALLLINDAVHLIRPYPNPGVDSHLFSTYLLLPFVGVSLALWWHNWYPAKVFVGDTYCYFAGMVFAICAILGHFSKTLLLLLVPQIFNFLYSVPQLAGIVACPRHRLPKFNARTGLMDVSVTEWKNPPHPLIAFVLHLLERLRMLEVHTDDKGNITETSNFTLLNLWIVWFGPMREDKLALGILGAQVSCGLLGLMVRHQLALLIYDFDNR